MLLQPAVLALLASSGLLLAMLAAASALAVRILRRWDLASGSALQLKLERRTYLVSTIVAWGCGLQLLSLFFFIRAADGLCSRIVGAMCAAGTLFANPWGYPALLLKLLTFVLAGLWLTLNHADSRAPDYPLIRPKYRLLLALTPLVAAENAVQAAYFLGLKADVITSCCGSLFGAGGSRVTARLAATPVVPTTWALALLLLLLLAAGVRLVRTGRGAALFASLAAAGFPAGVVGLISVISIYFYELPTHHCPFCLLQADYGYVGYVLYVALLGGATTGVGAGALEPFRRRPSLAEVVPAMQRRLATASCACYGAFGGISAARMVLTDFRP